MKRTPSILAIVNPNSGTSDKKEIISYLLRQPWCRVATTRGPGDATALARAGAEAGMKAVMAVGGDGTVHETALGLIGGDTPLAIIPAGSGNGLARHLRIPLRAEGALETVLSGKCVRIDYGTACARPFFCTMGMGFDAEVSHRFATLGTRGPISYARAALEVFLRYEAREYSIDTETGSFAREAMLITVANAEQYGNRARIAPGASMTDKLLDVTILRRGARAHTVEAALQLFAGGLDRNPLIERFRTRAMTVKCLGKKGDMLAAHLDGEPVRLPQAIDIMVRPGGLPVLIPY